MQDLEMQDLILKLFFLSKASKKIFTWFKFKDMKEQSYARVQLQWQTLSRAAILIFNSKLHHKAC
jgi:hypothetical protein